MENALNRELERRVRVEASCMVALTATCVGCSFTS